MMGIQAICIGLIAVFVLLYGWLEIRFHNTTYGKITHSSWIGTIFDAGKYGEYLTYKKLREYENKGGKFLFNCYVPKDDGKTTEIDVLLICEDGVFVFESKNYSGWIFGDETSRTWTQTLPAGRGRSHKEHFYNPVLQNKNHVKWLRMVIGDAIPMYSIIVFSERCELKKVPMFSPDFWVIKRDNIIRTVEERIRFNYSDKLTQQQIQEIYDTLYPFTQMTAAQKMKHIADIHSVNGRKKSGNENGGMKVEAAGCVDGNSNIDVGKDADKSGKSEDRLVKSILPKAEGNECEIKKREECKSEPDKIELDKADNEMKHEPVDNKDMTCQKCGAKMVLRTAKKGKNAGKQFYGCSAFPKCRWTREV